MIWALIQTTVIAPTVIFIAIQVYAIKQDNAVDAEKIRVLQQEILNVKARHNLETQKLEQQIDYLLKRLIDKTSLLTIPYHFEKYLPDLGTSEMPPIWLPIQPLLAKTETRKGIRWT